MPDQPSEVGKTLTARVGLCHCCPPVVATRTAAAPRGPKAAAGLGPDLGARPLAEARCPSHMQVGRELENNVHPISSFAKWSYYMTLSLMHLKQESAKRLFGCCYLFF